MRYLNNYITILSCLLLALGVCDVAHSSSFHPRISAVGARLIVNGQIAVTIDGDDARSRVSAAASALASSGARSVALQKITRRRWSLTTPQGGPVLMATRRDAASSGGTVEGVARAWAARLNDLLSMPALTVQLKERPLIVPTGGARSLVIGGAALSAQIRVADGSPGASSTRFFGDSRTITILGLKPGSTTVSVMASDASGGTASVDIAVEVEDRAGELNSDADVTVTGTPASADLLVQAARSAVDRSATLAVGAYLEVIQQPDLSAGLAAGADETVPFTVRAVGPDLIPVEQVISLHIRNDTRYAPETAQALYYSNNPETVKHPQSLFDAFLPGLDSPIRLVFHHQNIAAVAMVMRVEIINYSQSPAQIRLIRGAGVPVSDPIAAGTWAGTEFLRDWQNNCSELLELPAQSRIELFNERIEPTEVASGIFEIAQTIGSPHSLQVHVDAEPVDPSYQDGWEALDKVGGPDKCAIAVLPLTAAYSASVASETSSDQIYGSPALSATGSYAVGGTWPHVVIGTDKPLTRLVGDGSALAGNYGVIYSINIALSNPTAVRQKIAVNFAADAGDASGVFTVTGQPTATINNLSALNEQQIALVTLAPGETRNLVIQTIPLSGSAYPAAINAHAI